MLEKGPFLYPLMHLKMLVALVIEIQERSTAAVLRGSNLSLPIEINLITILRLQEDALKAA